MAENQQCKQIFKVSTRSRAKRGDTAEYLESVIGEYTDYKEAEKAARAFIESKQARRVAFIQVYRDQGEGIQYAKEYAIKRSPYKSGEGDIKSEGEAIRNFEKVTERKQRRREAWREAINSKKDFLEVYREMKSGKAEQPQADTNQNEGKDEK